MTDLPWSHRPDPWAMLGVFGLGLALGLIVGVAVGSGPVRGPVNQASDWTRDRGQQVVRRVRESAESVSAKASTEE